MSEQLYSIGRISELTGVSIQALRHYDSIGLIKPVYINENTGYRYYSYNQIQTVDRIKYLKKMGFSLNEIEMALKSGQVEDLIKVLDLKERKLFEEKERIQANIETIQWYRQYYNYLMENKFPNVPYKRHIEKRYALAVPCYDDGPIRASGPLRLGKAKNKQEFRDEDYLRQNGFILDLKALLSYEIRPKHYYIYLKNKPKVTDEYVVEFPEGEYLCFRGRLLVGDYDVSYIKSLYENKDIPELVIADEYEDNLKSFTHCVYELQILI